MDSYGVYTNTAPSAAFRGYGITQVAWAHETQMDIIADALAIDPIELRLKNVCKRATLLPPVSRCRKCTTTN
jgi:CO/xanthine dehydrogenase Mo-binding subunit